MTMKTYNGSCHCGAVHFVFDAEVITSGLRCNCSLCSRKGAVMSPAPIPRAMLQTHAQADALGLYQFGEGTAKHYFCRNCGIYTFHETARTPGHFRVNLGCVEGVDTFALVQEVFDGKHRL